MPEEGLAVNWPKDDLIITRNIAIPAAAAPAAPNVRQLGIPFVSFLGGLSGRTVPRFSVRLSAICEPLPLTMTLLSPILPSLKEIQANGVPFAGGTRVSIEPSDLLWTVANRRDQLMQRTGIVGVGSYPPTAAVNGHACEQVLFTDCAVLQNFLVSQLRTHLYLCLMVMSTQSILPETTLNI